MHTVRSAACALGAAATLAFALPASAQEGAGPNYFPNTSQELVELIEGCEDDSCMSYVSGVIGGVAIYAMIAEKPSPFCTRGEVGKEDIRDAIIDTVQSTEALEDQHPAVAVLSAFGRYWPCLTQEEVDALQSTALTPVAPELIDELRASEDNALIFGDLSAPLHKTITVFHDPNCPHCRRFRSQTAELASRGWKVVVLPVATSSEESAGYGAVEIALRESHPEAAEALYLNDPDKIADITLAMKVAEAQGVPTRDILTSIARAGAYSAIEANTRAFFEAGAQGTPAWIIGESLYSGYLNADAIEEIGQSFAGEDAYHDALEGEITTGTDAGSAE